MTRKTRIRTALVIAAATAAVIPASASAYVPHRGEAIDSIRSVIHDGQTAESVFQRKATAEEIAAYDLAPGVTINDEAVVRGAGHFWKGNLAPKVRRVRGGWASSAIVFVGYNDTGAVQRVVLGSFRIRSFHGGYSTTFRSITKPSAAPTS